MEGIPGWGVARNVPVFARPRRQPRRSWGLSTTGPSRGALNRSVRS